VYNFFFSSNKKVDKSRATRGKETAPQTIASPHNTYKTKTDLEEEEMRK
jgi:hypothetical protein